MRTTHLREHEWARGVPLSRRERDALLGLGRELTVAPTVEDGLFDLRPGSYAGAIVIDDHAFLIAPKIEKYGFERTLFLLSYALDRAVWSDETVSFAKDALFVDAIASAFSRAMSRALARGPLRGYQREEDSLHRVRGRIRFDDQIRVRLGIVPPVELAYDEFTPDIDENRILLAALRALRRMGLRSHGVARDLRGHERALDGVTPLEYARGAVPAVPPTRLNKHYFSSLKLARLILDAAAYELRSGDVQASAFLVNMNQVFEDFVVTALREALRLDPAAFPQSVRQRLWLARQHRVELRPDLSWWNDRGCIFVGDAKYKRTDLEHGEPSAGSADVYQLLAYVVATGLEVGMLVYAAGEGERSEYEIAAAGKTLVVRTLDLAGSPEQILEQVQRLADEIRAMASGARREYVAQDLVLSPA